VSGMLVRCADGTRCSPFASALFYMASSKDINQFIFRHSSRKLPLKDSMWGLSVGVPGRK